MKQLFAVIMSLVIALGLCACKQSDVNNNTSTKNSTTATTATSTENSMETTAITSTTTTTTETKKPLTTTTIKKTVAKTTRTATTTEKTATGTTLRLHDYVETYHAATCEKAAYYEYVCACGASYKEYAGPAKGHRCDKNSFHCKECNQDVWSEFVRIKTLGEETLSWTADWTVFKKMSIYEFHKMGECRIKTEGENVLYEVAVWMDDADDRDGVNTIYIGIVGTGFGGGAMYDGGHQIYEINTGEKVWGGGTTGRCTSFGDYKKEGYNGGERNAYLDAAVKVLEKYFEEEKLPFILDDIYFFWSM